MGGGKKHFQFAYKQVKERKVQREWEGKRNSIEDKKIKFKEVREYYKLCMLRPAIEINVQ